MLTVRFILAATILTLAIHGGAWGQTRPGGRTQPGQPPQQAQPAQPPNLPSSPPVTDQRGTDQMPLSVKVLPSPKSAEEMAKEERERQEKSEADKRLADETERLADEAENLTTATRWLAGLVLLLFVAALGQIALFWLQLRLMRQAVENAAKAAGTAQTNADSAEKTLITTQRAFVYPKSISKEWFGARRAKEAGEIVEWVFTPEWENSGTTPTKRGLSHVSWKRLPKGSGPETIQFGDQWAAGSKREHSRFFLAPKSSQPGRPVSISVHDLRSGDPCFVWGWVEYDDIFDTRHRSEFCVELELRGGPSTDPNAVAFRFYRLHNGADDECYRQPSPFKAE
jgi:hypothetical protein